MHDLIHPIFKWLHIFAGVMWIGLLYFFNFVNGAFAGTMDANTKKAVVPELMPRALYWFRWGAAWTWFTGISLLLVLFWNHGLSKDHYGMNGYVGGGNMFETDTPWNTLFGMIPTAHIIILFTFLAVFIYDFLYKKVKFGKTCPIANNTRLATIISFLLIAGMEYLMICCGKFSFRAVNIHIGAMFGTMMAFNVWFRIWPAQQKIIAAIKEGEAPDADLVALAGLRSKHNTYMSLPLLWTMINQHVSEAGVSGKFFNIDGAVLLIVIALGWHIIFQCYKRAGKVQGF